VAEDIVRPLLLKPTRSRNTALQFLNLRKQVLQSSYHVLRRKATFTSTLSKEKQKCCTNGNGTGEKIGEREFFSFSPFFVKVFSSNNLLEGYMEGTLKKALSSMGGKIVPAFNYDLCEAYRAKTGNSLKADLETALEAKEVVKDQLRWKPSNVEKNMQVLDDGKSAMVRINGVSVERQLTEDGRVLEDIYYLPEVVPEFVTRKQASQTAAKSLFENDDQAEEELSL
jgi:hypothetical protein